VRRRAALVAPAPGLIAVALALAACGGGDDEGSSTTTPTPATTTPAPSEAPSESPASPGAAQLPPQLVECFADKGIEVKTPDDLHSAPPEVTQECFSSLHGGGGP